MKLCNKIFNFFVKSKKDASEARRIETEKEAEKILSNPKKEENFIICNDKQIPIEWDSVVTFKNVGGLSLPKNCYRQAKNERIPQMFVVHWDVCLSSESCFNVLKKKGVSVHFCIDNDGTIYQLMDCNDIGWHAGNRNVNNNSVGVEISNAYYPKYQNIYRKKGFGPRPILHDVQVHGKNLDPFLGFYSVQEQALQALIKVLHKVYDIPLTTPMDGENILKSVDINVQRGIFKGVVNHYHVTTRKIDCAGLELDKILKNI